LLDQPWPTAPPILTEARSVLQAIQKRSWAWSIISSIPTVHHPALRQKMLADDIFGDHKAWHPGHPWRAVYLETPGNPHLEAYKKAMALHFSKHGDKSVNFCDSMNKVNRDLKVDPRAIVVTDINIYKHKPKKTTRLKSRFQLERLLVLL